jgi:hypothetical protein
MPKQEEMAPLAYIRPLYANILDWYRNADAKAQVLLTTAGVFLSFVSSLVFRKKEELEGVTKFFGLETWVLIALTAICLFLTIVFALVCLHSRLKDPEDLREHLHAVVNDKEVKLKQWPETLWFFGMIAQLQDRRRFQARLAAFTKADEVLALSSEIFILSCNVLRKHKWVNRGFICATLTLIFFLFSGASYLLRVTFFTESSSTTVESMVKPQARP